MHSTCTCGLKKILSECDITLKQYCILQWLVVSHAGYSTISKYSNWLTSGTYYPQNNAELQPKSTLYLILSGLLFVKQWTFWFDCWNTLITGLWMGIYSLGSSQMQAHTLLPYKEAITNILSFATDQNMTTFALPVCSRKFLYRVWNC